jgi:hypothetical protein
MSAYRKDTLEGVVSMIEPLKGGVARVLYFDGKTGYVNKKGKLIFKES